MTPKTGALAPIMLLLLLGIIWGSGYSLARYATTHGVPPLGYSFWQSVGPAIFLLIVTLIKEKRIRLDAWHLRYYCIAGVLGIALPNTNMYFAAPHVSAGLLAVVVNTVPVIMYPLALLSRQEKFLPWRMVSVIVGIIGVLIVVLQQTHIATVGSVSWLLIALLTPLFFAICALYNVHDRPRDSSSLSLATGMLVSSAIMLLPFVFDLHEFYPLTTWSLPNAAVVLEIVLSSIGYIVFFQLLKIAGAVYYSFVSGIVALTGLFWGWCVFGETLQGTTILAVGLIIVAVVLVSVLQPKAAIKK